MVLPRLSTLILKRADVSRHTDGLALLRELRETMKASAPPPIPARAVTVRSSGHTLVHLYDRETDALLALIDAEALFALRAALLAAVAVDALTAPEVNRVAVLGGGPASSGALKALRLVRSLREVWLVAPKFEQAVAEAHHLQDVLKTPVRSIATAAEAIARAEVVLLTGGVGLPNAALWPSVHLSVPSAGRFDASPVPAGVLVKSWRVGDAPGTVWDQPVQATLGAVLSGTAARPDGVNPMFIGSDPPSLDLLAAWHVYLGARGDEALPRVDFDP